MEDIVGDRFCRLLRYNMVAVVGSAEEVSVFESVQSKYKDKVPSGR